MQLGVDLSPRQGGPPPKLPNRTGIVFVVLLSVPLFVVFNLARMSSYNPALAPLEEKLSQFRLSAMPSGKSMKHAARAAHVHHASVFGKEHLTLAHVVNSHILHSTDAKHLHAVSVAAMAKSAANTMEHLVQDVHHSVHDFEVVDEVGETVSLSDYEGKVVLVVNIGSRCSLAQVNLKELQYLQHKLGPRGFSVLAFPSSQFDGEAGAGDETVRVVREKYHATFPVFGKVEPNGRGAHPLFAFLRKAFGMKAVPWNFQKFLVDRDGHPLAQYAPQVDPMAIMRDVETVLDGGMVGRQLVRAM